VNIQEVPTQNVGEQKVNVNKEENKQPHVNDEDEDEEGPIHFQRHIRTTSQAQKVIFENDLNQDM